MVIFISFIDIVKIEFIFLLELECNIKFYL